MALNPQNVKPHQFKKGQSGNPGGKPKLPKELKDIQQVTTHELQRYISKYFRMNRTQIVKACASEVLPMMEVAIARTLHVAAKNGEFHRLLPLLDRLLGKVKEHIISVEDSHRAVVILPSNGRDEPES